MSDWQLQTEIWRRFAKPLELVAWLANLSILLAGLLFEVTPARLELLGVTFTLASIYLVVFFHWILPKNGIRPGINYLIAIINVSLIITYAYLLSIHGFSVNLLLIIVIAFLGSIAGSKPAFVAALFSTMGDICLSLILGEYSTSMLIPKLYNLITFLLTAYLCSTLGNILQRRTLDAIQQTKKLAMLVDASAAVTASLDLKQSLPQLSEKIIKGLPASFCRIDLVDSEHKKLNLYALSAQRMANISTDDLSNSIPYLSIPWLNGLIETHQSELITASQIVAAHEQMGTDCCFFPNRMQSVYLLPLSLDNETLGLITVGEERSAQREPFDEKKIDLLKSLANQVTIIIQNAFLHELERKKSDRLTMLNQVTQVIGSTIELDVLLEKIYQLLNQVMPCDTYYVGLYQDQSKVLDIRILIDDDQRFPPTTLSINQGLVSQVIQKRQPYIIHHLSEEIHRLPVKPVILGKNKSSESWLGVPMISGNKLVGVLAVASYKPYAFDESDLALIVNVANQSAVALDNANHYAEMEQQARTDSLTGVYNHGYFLERLDELARNALQNDTPLSLVMLDIDYFKDYNDQYGHVLGDEVLRLTTQAIKSNIRDTDLIGRWGGEEFGIILPNTPPDTALQVAECIRATLARLLLLDKQGQPIPKPTVSQGIATLPTNAKTAPQLVDVADQALYLAKSAGRDQIRVSDKN